MIVTNDVDSTTKPARGRVLCDANVIDQRHRMNNQWS
jgi:hypothetical protein